MLGLYGGQDQGIPADDVAAMREALARAGKPAEFVVIKIQQMAGQIDV